MGVFVGVTNPAEGRSSGPAGVWLAASGLVAALTAVCALVGARLRPGARAALFGAAAGVLFGYQAAAMNEFVGLVPAGLGAVLRGWAMYALILSALGGFYLLQSALQVGVLAPALATSNAASPVTSVALGRFVFLETAQRTVGGKVASIFSVLVLGVGLPCWLAGRLLGRLIARAERRRLRPPRTARRDVCGQFIQSG